MSALPLLTDLVKVTEQARNTPGHWVYVSERVKCIVRHGGGRRVRWYLAGRASSLEKCLIDLGKGSNCSATAIPKG